MPPPERVRAWEAAIEVAARTRDLFTHFPKRGYAELRDQMARSSESIGNNIAEGSGSDFELEYIRFLDMAVRSSNELSSQLTTAMRYGIVPKWTAFNLKGTVICTRRMIESLKDSVRADYEARRARQRAARSKPRKKPPGRRKNS